jgi:hypothetical protein
MSRKSWESYNKRQPYFCCRNKFQSNSFGKNFHKKCLFPDSFVLIKCSISVVVLSCENNKNIYQNIKKVEAIRGITFFEKPGLKTGRIFNNMPFPFNYSPEYGVRKDPDCCTLLKEVNLKNFNNVLESSIANIYNCKDSFLKLLNVSDFSNFENSILYCFFEF